MIRTVWRLAVIAVVAVLLQSAGFLIGTSTSQPDASDPLLRPPTDAGTGLAAGSSFDDYRVMSDPLPAGPAGDEEDAELVPETPEDVAILDSPIPGTTPAQTAGRVPAQTTTTTTTSNKAAPTTTTTTSPPTSTTSTT
ncbi:MAG: hypothetical protein HKN80_09960, partial [Acidimicrobiia bacterium]|nr:hypothetical protein [Acidimicrobiia bacterium]